LPPEYAQPARLHYLELAGTLDKRNRYSAAVEIETSAPTQAGIHGLCNGVLVSPRLVLTAGHSVCMRKPTSNPGQHVIDGSSCATAPVVTTLVYPPAGDEAPLRGTGSQSYRSLEVWPHPAFKILLNTEGQVESTHADLALILLESPVRESYTPLSLTDEAVHVGEPIVMVGGTFDEILGGIAGQRRFIRYMVERLVDAESGWVSYAQPKRDLYRGSSGGPCVREGPQGPALVGISSRGLGEEPGFTSIHPYRDWLRSALQSVKSR
jgi:hypothetical protein